MKKSELKTLVRTIVREEVAMAIREVITEMKEPIQQVNTISNGEIRKTKPKRKKVVSEKKHFSNNSVLNDVLNETANDDSDWETMSGKKFNSKNMNDILHNQYGGMMGGSNIPIPQTDINDRPVTSVSDTLMDNLTKDYSGVLKSMKKTADKSRGGH